MRGRALVAVMAAASSLVAAGCGSTDSSSSGGAATGTGTGSAPGSASGSGSGAPVKFTFIVDQAGPGGLYGKAVLEGAQVNLDRINGQGGVNGHKLEMSVVDSASKQDQATAAITQAARGDNAAVLYGVLSGSALAMAPIAQREKAPFIVSYAQVDDVTKPGDYVYRTTTSEGKFYDGMVKYMAQQKGMKTMTVWFASDNTTAVENTNKTMPALAQKYGVQILGNVSVKSTDTDFSSSAAQIAAQKPDGVAVLILGAGVTTAITALRTAGYTGNLFGSSALGAGALTAAGDNGANTYYPSSILSDPKVPWKSGQDFLQLFKSKTGKDATAFNAAGYDQIQMLAEAVRNVSGEVTRDALHTALLKVTAAGFSGATGDPVRFDDKRIAVTPGVLVLWDGKKETYAAGQPAPLLEEYGH